jgi:hypothetical protein
MMLIRMLTGRPALIDLTRAATGLATRTVDDIINGRNGWGEIIANDNALRNTAF